MTDKPIIFSAPMVRAMLEGRKTQTRRIAEETTLEKASWSSFNAERRPVHLRLPYAPGDRLWVREAVRFDAEWDDCKPSDFDRVDAIHYEADERCEKRAWGDPFRPGRIRPSIHMPRWASRLTLIVTDVRVQRLQEISEGDARDEGAERGAANDPLFANLWTHGTSVAEKNGPPVTQWFFSASESFRALWNSLHGADAWDANPWVAAISFEVKRGNIDQVSTAIAEGRT